MKRLLILMFAILPLGAALMVLQSCGGQGGATGKGPGLVSPTAAFLALLPISQANASYIGTDKCATCHNDPSNPHFSEWQLTKHAANNVTCERCHGPGSIHAASPGTAPIQADPTTSNILTLPNVASPTVCAQCHGPIADDYNASPHAGDVEPGNSGSPATNVSSSRCSACHQGVVRVASYDNPANAPGNDGWSNVTQALAYQWAGFDASGNNYNPNSPTAHTAVCVTCHNPHKVTGKLDKDGEEHQIRHETTNTDEVASSAFANAAPLIGGYGANTGPNSTPASFQTLDQVCAQCHNGRGVTPTDAKLATGTSRPSMHDSPQFNMLMGYGAMEEDGAGVVQLPTVRNMAHSTAPGQCTHCHMGDPAHSHQFIANAGPGCAPCHSVDDAASKQVTVTNDIINKTFALQQRLRGWSQATFGDPDLWDYTSLIVGKTPPNQTLVPIQVKRARHNYYMILRDKSLGVHNYPYTVYTANVANDNLDAVGAPAIARPATGLTIQQKKASIMADLKRAQQADREATDY